MSEHQEIPETIAEIDEAITKLLDELAGTFGDSGACRPFLLTDTPITRGTVDKVFDELQKISEACSEEGAW